MTKSNKPGRPPFQDILTPAEWRVVQRAKHGFTNQEIANSLKISINAVKYHITNVIEKLRCLPEYDVKDKRSLLELIAQPKSSLVNKSSSMNDKVNINSIGQISRKVSDITKSINWYKNTLKLKHLFTYETIAFFDLNGVRLMLSETTNNTANDKSILYFYTNNIMGLFQSLKKEGCEFTHSPHKVHTHEDGTEEWMAFFNDPDERPLGLMSQIKP